MRTRLHRQIVSWPAQRPVRAWSTRAEPLKTPEITEAVLPISDLKNRQFWLRSRLAGFKRWIAEMSYRLATNRYVFYGALILAGSLIVGAFSKGHDSLWRSTAALGTATVIIGLLHAWLDARSARKGSRSLHKRRVRKL